MTKINKVSKEIRTKYYVNNKQMLEELVKYKETGIISEQLGVMIMNIAMRYTSMANFRSYTYRDEMISDAIYRMITQIDKFDVNHPSANPFAYFTMITQMAVITRIKREKKLVENIKHLQKMVWDELNIEEQFERD